MRVRRVAARAAAGAITDSGSGPHHHVVEHVRASGKHQRLQVPAVPAHRVLRACAARRAREEAAGRGGPRRPFPAAAHRPGERQPHGARQILRLLAQMRSNGVASRVVTRGGDSGARHRQGGHEQGQPHRDSQRLSRCCEAGTRWQLPTCAGAHEAARCASMRRQKKVRGVSFLPTTMEPRERAACSAVRSARCMRARPRARRRSSERAPPRAATGRAQARVTYVAARRPRPPRRAARGENRHCVSLLRPCVVIKRCQNEPLPLSSALRRRTTSP